MSSWHDAGYCNSSTPAPSSCVLWGVAWEQLCLAGAILVVLVPPARLWLYLSMGLFFATVKNNVEAKTAWKSDYLPWGVLFWRCGFVWVAYTQLYVPSSVANDVLSRIISLAFCLAMVLSCDSFMRCLSILVVFRVNQYDSKRQAAKSYEAFSSKPEHHHREQVTKSSAIGEIMTFLRVFVLVIVILLAFSFQGVNLVAILNVSSMYTLGLTIAVIPIGRSMYAGMVMFGVTMDAFRFGALVSAAEEKGTLEATSISRVILRNKDGELVIIPQNVLVDTCASFMDQEVHPFYIALPIRDPRSAPCNAAVTHSKWELAGIYRGKSQAVETRFQNVGLNCNLEDGLSVVCWTLTDQSMESEMVLMCVDELHHAGMRIGKVQALDPMAEDFELVSPACWGRACEYPEHAFWSSLMNNSFGLILSADEFAGLDEAFLQAHSVRCLLQDNVKAWI